MQWRLLVLGIVCGGAVLSQPEGLRAADYAAPVRTAGYASPEGACLRWVWQEYSWYDDCWAQRHPYIGRGAWSERQVRRVYR